MPSKAVYPLVSTLGPPLGAMSSKHSDVMAVLLQLEDVPIHDDNVHFIELLRGLCQRVTAGAKEELEPEAMKIQAAVDNKFVNSFPERKTLRITGRLDTQSWPQDAPQPAAAPPPSEIYSPVNNL